MSDDRAPMLPSDFVARGCVIGFTVGGLVALVIFALACLLLRFA